ncbi:MAG: hypothetical protein KAR08_10555 [Candidatus Heimdallarchaeota archaeon]|nr:hypothetical protein [Candidatus Heimdallarchaeota archaeon]
MTIKTREEIQKTIDRLKQDVERIRTSDNIYADIQIATLTDQIGWLEEILALEGNLEDHKEHLNDKYMDSDTEESGVYSWVLGDGNILDEFEE